MSDINPFTFLAFALWVLVPAVCVVTLKNVFHAGLCLILSFIGVAGVYILLTAEFVAAIQILVYSGGIAVLILFAIMTTKRLMDKTIIAKTEWTFSGLLISLIFLGMVVVVLASTAWNLNLNKFQPYTISDLGNLIMNHYTLPFELVSIVLLTALIGALVIAGKENK